MPAGPGESLLATVYADVHYIFRHTTPSEVQHDRFSKGSYVYLYYSSTTRRSKLEIANHAGTPDQDAFYGYLEAVHSVDFAANHPTLCSIVLDQARVTTQAEWHLPTWDDRNEKRWSHKLYTIDLYFWTERDGATFINQMKSILPAEQLNASTAPASRHSIGSEHRDSMSPVVQQLERTALGSHYPPRAGSTTSAQSLPGPPTPASNTSIGMPPAAAGGYNPAAPAAPEPIAHREKTPPPPDGEAGTGLTNAARYDAASQQPYSGIQQQPYTGFPQQSQQAYTGIPQQQYAQYQQTPSSLQTTPQASYFPGPPQAAAPAPAQPYAQRQPSFGPTASSTITPTSIAAPNSNTYDQQPPTPSAPPAYAMHAAPPPPPPTNSASPAKSNNTPQEDAFNQSHQIAGFSSYSYANTQSPPPGAGGQYNPHGAFVGGMHQQLYRPTEAEAAHSNHGGKGKAQAQPTQAGPEDKYKIGERVSRVEKGIGSFLKRLDNL